MKHSALGYYKDNAKAGHDPQVIAMLALTDAIIDHRVTVQEESEQTREVLEQIARNIERGNQSQ